MRRCPPRKSSVLSATGLSCDSWRGARLGRVLFLDIETSTSEADTGIIIGIGLMGSDGRGDFLFCQNVGGERKVLQKFLKTVPDYDAIVTWRGRGFDVPFIIARALKLSLPVDPLTRALHVDVADIAERYLRLGRKDLASVCRYFKIKKNIELSGMDMPSLYLRVLEGDKRAARQIKVHCIDDLASLREVYERLKPLVSLNYPNL